jgi:acyl-coenzyme A thioesterase PaaI-like protein
MIPLTVREAPQGATWGVDVLQLPGLDVLRASLERRLPDPPVTKLTGLRLSEVGLATASAWMPATGWWQTAAGVFLAGTTAFVADVALGSSVLSSAPAGVGVTTSELSVSFLRAATIRSQTITGRGWLIHATRSLGLAEASLTDAGRRDPSALLPVPGRTPRAGIRGVDDHGDGRLGVAVRWVRGCVRRRDRVPRRLGDHARRRDDSSAGDGVQYLFAMKRSCAGNFVRISVP